MFVYLFIYVCICSSNSGSHAGDAERVHVSEQHARQAPARDAEAGRVLGRAAERSGEDVPEAEVHQQAGQEETGVQAGTQGLAGKLHVLDNTGINRDRWTNKSTPDRSTPDRSTPDKEKYSKQ